jgi:hypothetical protein
VLVGSSSYRIVSLNTLVPHLTTHPPFRPASLDHDKSYAPMLTTHLSQQATFQACTVLVEGMCSLRQSCARMQVRVSTDKLSHTFFSRQQLQSASHIFSAVFEKLANPWQSEADRERALKAWNSRDATRRPPRTDSSMLSVYLIAGSVFPSF